MLVIDQRALLARQAVEGEAEQVQQGVARLLLLSVQSLLRKVAGWWASQLLVSVYDRHGKLTGSI